MSDINLLRETLSWINSIPLDDHHNYHNNHHHPHPNHNDRYNCNQSKIDMMNIDDNQRNRLGYHDVIMNPSNYFYDMKFLKMNNINHDNCYYSRLIDKHYWLKRFVYHTLKKSITRQQLLYRIYYYNIDRLQLYVYNYFQYWYHRSKLNNNRTKKMIKNMRRYNYHSIIQSSHHLNKVEIILRYNYKLHNYLLFWYFYIKSLKKIKIRYWKLMILIYRGHELLRKVRGLFSFTFYYFYNIIIFKKNSVIVIFFNSSKYSPLFPYINYNHIIINLPLQIYVFIIEIKYHIYICLCYRSYKVI